MENFKISVKGFVFYNGKLLIVKRAENDVHKPGVWEPPGGRLENGEDPFIGLKREVKEEAGIDIEILNPLGVKHFTREDGQKVTMLLFLCKSFSNDVILTEEHSDFEWVDVNKAKSKLPEFFHPEIDNYIKFEMERLF